MNRRPRVGRRPSARATVERSSLVSSFLLGGMMFQQQIINYYDGRRCYFSLGVTLRMSVILSPLSKIRPTETRRCFFSITSSASSRTRFMYSSKPTIRPSTHVSVFSYIQICTRAFVCKKRKIKFCRARTSGETRRDGQSVCLFGRARAGAGTTLTSALRSNASLARARSRRCARGGRLVRTPRTRPVRARASVARGRPRFASIRARANTYDRLRHDSLHFRRHGASFTSFERARDVRGGV